MLGEGTFQEKRERKIGRAGERDGGGGGGRERKRERKEERESERECAPASFSRLARPLQHQRTLINWGDANSQ